MKIALLSFAPESGSDSLGEMLLSRLQAAGAEVVKESLRPDLGRLKGLLLAALTDPRFDSILVIANLPALNNQALVEQVQSILEPLPTWQPLVNQILWPSRGSATLWNRSCLGRSHRRLLAAFTGETADLELVLSQLFVPELDNLVSWAQSKG
jgi:hypothetical protein